MSVIFSNEIGCIISHSNFITNVYHNITRENTISKFRLREDLFKITYPFKQIFNYVETVEVSESPKKRKLKRKYVNLDHVVSKVKDTYEDFLQSARNVGIFPAGKPAAGHGANEEARRAAEDCSTASVVLSSLGEISGGNTAPEPQFQHLHNKKCDILLPANCRFICGDVRTTLPKLDGQIFELVILDPPWWNKYIRRSKAKKPDSSYQMLYNEEIVNLPLSGLLSSGAVVGVWCTNCAAHEQAIKEQMFPAWGVQYVATWFWLKITEVGDPVGPFTELNGKQPFERIILGIHEKFPNQPSPQEGRIILSVPSALHSHKPPLNDVLAPFLALESGNNCLEIFARYLLPNTTSVGLEPLKWQHSSLYVEDTDNCEPENDNP